MTQTLYDRIGGRDAVDAAVDIFYTKILADDRVAHFFANTDMKRQAAHQKIFLTYAFGGAQNYPGKSMREAHKPLVENQGLNEDHFNAVAENLSLTLQELNVPSNLHDEVMAVVGSTKDDVLCR
jgi:hemoglobin